MSKIIPVFAFMLLCCKVVDCGLAVLKLVIISILLSSTAIQDKVRKFTSPSPERGFRLTIKSKN